MVTIEKKIVELCINLGKDTLLVQGAGGNISWKESDTLWVKGSGTWLANANKGNIFVPVNLSKLTQALLRNNFEVQPELVGIHPLSPSIETALHALMPQKIVAHLHAVEALAHLIHADSQNRVIKLFKQLNDEVTHPAFIKYYKPGGQLAQAIQETLTENPKTNVIFLKNHGIVLGADSADEINSLLKRLRFICNENIQIANYQSHELPAMVNDLPHDYIYFPDNEVQSLALDPHLFSRLLKDWVLYPDHVIFLGIKSFTYSSWQNFFNQIDDSSILPELIFVKNKGVFVRPEFNLTKAAQLRCYFDVIRRVMPHETLDPLSQSAINELLNWDAEKLRQKLAGQNTIARL